MNAPNLLFVAVLRRDPVDVIEEATVQPRNMAVADTMQRKGAKHCNT